MRLLHVFSAPQSAYYFLEGQLQFMLENGCEVHVIIPDDGFFSKKLVERDSNVKFHFIPLKRKVSIINDVKNLALLYKAFREIKPDLLHLHTPKASFIGAVAGRLAMLDKIIYQMHGLVSVEGNKIKKNLFYFLEKATCALVTRVFAVSKSLRDFAVDNEYCQLTKIKVLGNGTINGIEFSSKFNPVNAIARNTYLTDVDINDKFVVGFIGRISEDKGIKDFLDVISRLSQRIPIVAVVVGPNELGKEWSILKSEWEQSNINCELKVFSEVQDPESILVHFDVLLFPTKREGFGLVAAEANSLNIPVVAYDIPGVRDAVENGRTGVLVPYANVSALADAVLEYYSDESKRLLHGANGRSRVMNLFDREKLWVEILNEYKSLNFDTIQKEKLQSI